MKELHTVSIRFLACVMLLLALAPCRAQETSRRDAISADIQAAFERGAWGHIEKSFAEFHRNDERVSSGATKSGQVLLGLRSAIGRPIQSERTQDHWTTVTQKAAAWLKEHPNSSLAAYAGVHAHIGLAFFHRGNRMAVDVPADKWPLYEAELRKASEYLAPGNTVSRDAVWHTAVLTLAKYQGVDLQTYIRVLDQATTKWPHFHDLYYVATERLQPRWGGSAEAFDWLAELATEKTRATEGTALYARVYWVVARGEGMSRLFEATQADWKKMKAGFDDIVSRYPDAWNYNHYAWFACSARDAAATRQAFEKVGDELDASLWSNRQRLNRCRELARGGE